MWIKRISLSGYRSASPSRPPLLLEGFGHRNVFIGPNNVGKSTIIRFLQTVTSLIREDFELYRALSANQLDANWWWQHQIANPIKSEIVFALPLPNGDTLIEEDADAFVADDKWRITVEIAGTPGKGGLLIITPLVHVDGDWRSVVRQIADDTRCEFLNGKGVYTTSNASDACPYIEPARQILLRWSQRTRFFDPVRALDRSDGPRHMIDGSDVLQKIRDLERDPKSASQHQQFADRLTDVINDLVLVPGTDRGDRLLFLVLWGQCIEPPFIRQQVRFRGLARSDANLSLRGHRHGQGSWTRTDRGESPPDQEANP